MKGFYLPSTVAPWAAYLARPPRLPYGVCGDRDDGVYCYSEHRTRQAAEKAAKQLPIWAADVVEFRLEEKIDE